MAMPVMKFQGMPMMVVVFIARGTVNLQWGTDPDGRRRFLIGRCRRNVPHAIVLDLEAFRNGGALPCRFLPSASFRRGFGRPLPAQGDFDLGVQIADSLLDHGGVDRAERRKGGSELFHLVLVQIDGPGHAHGFMLPELYGGAIRVEDT